LAIIKTQQLLVFDLIFLVFSFYMEINATFLIQRRDSKREKERKGCRELRGWRGDVSYQTF
jgi:hypothetical protein